jgi:N-acetyl-D-muramate 6-phosphate phosphatase
MTTRHALVLFDLDGTLIDSAPDLAGAANAMRVARGMEALSIASLRPMVGAGARGMVRLAFGVHPGEDNYEALRSEFLQRYEEASLVHTRVFASVEPVLDRLEAQQCRWGIVTNKAERFTHPIVEGLGLHTRAAVLVCGDTTPHSNPHPAPLLEAARRAGVDGAHCLYIGDDARDIQAGRAAGMATLAAAWGYLGQGEPIDAWGADAVLAEPAALLHWLGLA